MKDLTKKTTLRGFPEDHSIENLNYSILNEIDAFVFILDVEEMRPLWLNDFFSKRLHYSKRELFDLTSDQFLNVFHKKSLENFKQRIKNIEQTEKEGLRSVYQIKTKTGEWMYMLISSRVYKRNQDGGIKLLLGFATEVEESELNRHMKKIRSLEGSDPKNALIKKLGSREMDVIRLITWGMTDKEISEKLKVSIHTAKTHRKRIISKLGLKNTAALVKFAVENKLD